jgi:hypothetical protein
MDTAINALPTIGGAVGSFAGGAPTAALKRLTGINLPNPLGMTGGALGGMAGEGFKQTANALRGRLDLVPRTMGAQLQSIGAAGVEQGGMEAVGGVVGKGLTKIGSGLYRGGVALLPRTLKQEFPTLAREGYREGVALTRGGAARASRLTGESADEADALIAAREAARPRVRGLLPEGRQPVQLGETPVPSGGRLATPLADVTQFRRQSDSRALQGMDPDDPLDPIFGGMARSDPPIPRADVVEGAGTVLQPTNAPGTLYGAVPGMISLDDALRHVPEATSAIGGRALGRNEPGLRTISQLVKRTETGRPWPTSLTSGQAIKRSEQDVAQRAYRARDAGRITQISPRAQFAEKVAKGIREGLEREVDTPTSGWTPRATPLRAINARTQSLMGLDRAATHASETGHILSRLGGIGAGALLGSAGGVLPALAVGGAGAMLTTPGGLTRTGLGFKGLGRGTEKYGANLIRAALLAQMLGEQAPE